MSVSRSASEFLRDYLKERGQAVLRSAGFDMSVPLPEVLLMLEARDRDRLELPAPGSPQSSTPCPYCLKFSTHRDDVGIRLWAKRACFECQGWETAKLLERIAALESGNR